MSGEERAVDVLAKEDAHRCLGAASGFRSAGEPAMRFETASRSARMAWFVSRLVSDVGAQHGIAKDPWRQNDWEAMRVT
jgi:hypothetical protein